jgi:hypothetical protein
MHTYAKEELIATDNELAEVYTKLLLAGEAAVAAQGLALQRGGRIMKLTTSVKQLQVTMFCSGAAQIFQVVCRRV